MRLLPQTVYSNHPAFSFSTDSLHDLTDGVFIFEAVSTEDSRTTQGYDAIVVEQWTVLDVSVGLGRDAFRLDRGGFIRSLLRVRLPLDSRWTAGHPEDPCCPWGPSCAPKVGEGPPLFPFRRKHNRVCQTTGQKRFLFNRLKGLSDVSEVDAWFVGPVIMRASSLLELDPPAPL